MRRLSLGVLVTGAVSPMYLYTAEAFEQYFSHLRPDGVLQINNFAYPRMITTAALAWRRLGLTDFQRHVAVYFCPGQLTLPTLLIAMKPWTPAQLASLDAFLGSPALPPKDRLSLVENPLDPAESFLPAVFYSGRYPAWLAKRVPADFSPVTDNRPYYGELRTHLGRVAGNPSDFLDPGTAFVLNSSILHGVPMDVMRDRGAVEDTAVQPYPSSAPGAAGAAALMAAALDVSAGPPAVRDHETP